MRATPILAALALMACANGDGRGFATVQGTLQVAADDLSFTTAAGEAGTLTALTVGVASLRLEANTLLAPDELLVTSSTLPIGAHWAPLAGQFQLPFGPYEVDGASYDTLAVVVTRLEVEATVGERTIALEVLPGEGIAVRTGADLAANRDRPPVITLSTVLNVTGALLNGLDLDAADAAERLAERLPETATVNATWTRKSD